MKQSDFFGEAKWLGIGNARDGDQILVLRDTFFVNDPRHAEISIIGLGFFYCYINGERVCKDLYMPMNTDYEARDNFPLEEKLHGHRIYVSSYDISPFLKSGKNTIAVHFGGGWYTQVDTYFGEAKLIYRIDGESADGRFEHISDTNAKISKSYVSEYVFSDQYNYKNSETHDLTNPSYNFTDNSFDDSSWSFAVEAIAPNTEYMLTNCPADRICETFDPKCIKSKNGSDIYDVGKNITGYPVLHMDAPYGERITVLFSEELEPDGEISKKHGYGQTISFISDGKGECASPLFNWYGFRYFEVIGSARVEKVEFVHTDLRISANFESDNEVLNWLNEAFINTQLCNSHGGIPSDCPHLEKRGYTGDGQLTCHAVMNIFDAKDFYKKWIGDISDCQDVYTGHVQNTAPYTYSGGGPGGWGSAIVEVPYRYYLHYGDDSVLRELYPQMLRYFDYLEEHSWADLVVTDKKGMWCLGDWAAPDTVAIPSPFVNNYFYIKSLKSAIEIAKVIGKDSDISMFEERIDRRKEAIFRAYSDMNGVYIGCIQGANAFVIDIGLGNENTYRSLVDYYTKLGHYDTGMFGTDIVTRVLLEHGDAELAVSLMASTHETSFYGMMKAGATTIWEHFPGSYRQRSKNHPMYGAVAAYLYDYLLGIRAKGSSVAYKELLISPLLVSFVNELKGSRELPSGKVSVEYKKTKLHVEFIVSIPDSQMAEFSFNGEIIPLHPGENRLHFKF